MNARFADWDTRNPQTADYVIVNDFYDVERLAPRPSTSSRLATAPEPSARPGPPMTSSAGSSSKPALQQDSRSAIVRPVSLVRQWKSFGPIWVNEQPGLDIANELNLKNEGISVVPPEMVRKSAAPIRFEPMPMAAKVYREVQLELARWTRTLSLVRPRGVIEASSSRRSEPIVAVKNTRGVVAEKLILRVQGIGINPPLACAKQTTLLGPAPPVFVSPPRPALASLTSFGPMESSASLYFDGELTPPAKSVLAKTPTTAMKPSASPVAVRPKLSPSVAETLEFSDDLDIEVAGEPEQQDDGFGTPAPTKKAPISAAHPQFDRLEVNCDYYVGTAFDLNSRNDGLCIPTEPVVHTANTDVPAPQSAREISRAVKLTRDAVYAWVNVLTGPALVTVSQSN